MTKFDETLYDAWNQSFSVDEVLFEQKTDHQSLIIFQNPKFGRVMALDGIVQTTERDEFIYHEMLTHLPILAHGGVEKVLIIGGGDGGILREVCRHKSVEKITMVEIDPAVVDMSKKFLPNHSDGAFDDPRLELVFNDGAAFARECDEVFDLIIVDSTDPIGPGEALFARSFYDNCKRLLSDEGVLVTQNGVSFMQPEEARQTSGIFTDLFADAHFYSAAVPTYVGGIMLFGWGCKSSRPRRETFESVSERYAASRIQTRFYNPAIHCSAFALPTYVLELIGKTYHE